LRDTFSRRGVSLSATALAGSLSAGAVQAAPAGLATAISTAALGGAAVATATTLATEGASTAMNLINLKTAAAILGAAAVTGTATYVVQERETEQLRAENTALNQTHAKLASDQQEALAMIQLRDEQIERLKRDVADLPRLRGEVDRLNRRLADFAAVNAERERLRAELDHLKESLANARTSLPDVRSVPAAQLTTEPVELETRTFRIQSDQLVARLRQATLGATPSATATEVFVSYLQQNGIQLNASDRVLLDEEQNRIVVRTETETMERITDLIGQLKDDVADAR
jgi:SMC interacting uncharacterized protein involved in chromosome segregation